MKNARTKKVNRKSGKGATRPSSGTEKKRYSSAWLNRVLILVAAGAVLTVAAWGFVSLNAIPVEHIIVAGKLEHTKTTALEDRVQPALVGGFLSADIEHIREQLESLPWVHEASVRRRWPNALELHIVEQRPIARWGDDGFLNHEGLVFHSIGDDKKWQTLPLLRGPQGTAGVLTRTYQQLVEVLAPSGLLVEELAIDNRGQVEAVLQGGAILVMGSENHLERLRRFVAIYKADLALKAADIQRVDLRYRNGLAVAFRDEAKIAER